MAETQKIRKQTMIHLEPAEVLSVLRAAKAKGIREWAMIVAGVQAWDESLRGLQPSLG